MFWAEYEAISLKFICGQNYSHELAQHHGLVLVYPDGFFAK